MPENENQYELDNDYAPLGIVDAADGSGTTWPEFVGQVNKMDNQVAALTEVCDSRTHGPVYSSSLTSTSEASWASVTLPDQFDYVILQSSKKSSGQVLAERIITVDELRQATASSPVTAAYVKEPGSYMASAYAEGSNVYIRARGNWDIANLWIAS